MKHMIITFYLEHDVIETICAKIPARNLAMRKCGVIVLALHRKAVKPLSV